jgi:hypothetical protein
MLRENYRHCRDSVFGLVFRRQKEGVNVMTSLLFLAMIFVLIYLVLDHFNGEKKVAGFVKKVLANG